MSKILTIKSLLMALILSNGLYATLLQENTFGTAGFSTGPDNWYEISTDSYPAATPFSQNRNVGISSGNVYLSPTGLVIGEAGDYLVSISAVLQNLGPSDIIVPVFLAVEKQGDPITTEIDPENPNPIGAAAVIKADTFFIPLTGTGILKGIEPGTRLSLVATNAGYPEPQPVTVVSWGITAHKL